MSSSAKVYADEIFTATDLNRRPGKVLDEATHRPVTITRNEETFALLLRKDAAHMVEAAESAKVAIDLMGVVSAYRLAGKPIPAEHTFEWINAFDAEDTIELLMEVRADFQRASNEEISWDDFYAVLNEWHKSAIAIRSEELAAAFSSPMNEEVPLTPPVATVDQTV